jgi:hypothetical protein
MARRLRSWLSVEILSAELPEASIEQILCHGGCFAAPSLPDNDGKSITDGMILEKEQLEFRVADAKEDLVEGKEILQHVSLHNRISFHHRGNDGYFFVWSDRQSKYA